MADLKKIINNCLVRYRWIWVKENMDKTPGFFLTEIGDDHLRNIK